MFAALQPVRVHRQAHGTARLAPFEAGLDEDPVQAFLLGLLLDQPGTRHHQRLLDGRGDLAAPGHFGGSAQVLDPRVGAGTDEYPVQLDVGDRLVRPQAHVLQGALDRTALDRVALAGRVRHVLVHGQDHFRRRAPADLRLDLRGVQLDHGIEAGIGVRHQPLPAGDGLVPLLGARREGPALHVVDGLLVDGDQADAGARLDRHVADGHPPFDGQVADGAAGELDGVAVAAGGADPADHREDDILRRDAGRQPAFDLDQHVLHLLRHQALGRQHMLYLGSADAVGQRAEGAVGGSVRVAADHGHPREGRALLRTDHMDDALAHVVHLEFGDAEVVAVLVEGLHLQARDLVGDGGDAALALGAGGRHVVVRGGDVGVDPPRLAPGQAKTLEGLRRGHFVQDMAVDVDQRRTVVALLDQVHVPEFVVEGLAGHRDFLISSFLCPQGL
ncbi:Flp pilus assembly protein TadG [Pseudomonas aeruginosa]|nr:Flp pilus assembly protein TadG [Pseudomonas aeruginosa]